MVLFYNLRSSFISVYSVKYDVEIAALHDDMLSIDLIASAGDKIGRGIASLINLFNPELVILGGVLAEADAYIRLPIKNAINKYSLNLVNTDTKLTMSELGKKREL